MDLVKANRVRFARADYKRALFAQPADKSLRSAAYLLESGGHGPLRGLRVEELLGAVRSLGVAKCQRLARGLEPDATLRTLPPKQRSHLVRQLRQRADERRPR